MTTFTDKVVLITGTNRGIGKALLDAVLNESPKKVYATARDISKIETDDERVEKVTLDITSSDSVQTLSSLGAIDILVNNAGVFDFAEPVLGADKNMEVNYYGTLAVTKVVASQMAHGGAIVTISSIVGLAPMPAVTGYSASKAALHSAIQSWRSQLKGKNVMVFGVYPGAIETDMTKGLGLPTTDVTITTNNIIAGVKNDEIFVFPDPMSASLGAEYLKNPHSLELALV